MRVYFFIVSNFFIYLLLILFLCSIFYIRFYYLRNSIETFKISKIIKTCKYCKTYQDFCLGFKLFEMIQILYHTPMYYID